MTSPRRYNKPVTRKETKKDATNTYKYRESARESGPPVDGLELNEFGLSSYFTSKVFRFYGVEEKNLLLLRHLHLSPSLAPLPPRRVKNSQGLRHGEFFVWVPSFKKRTPKQKLFY